jgi:hypothetical protein
MGRAQEKKGPLRGDNGAQPNHSLHSSRSRVVKPRQPRALAMMSGGLENLGSPYRSVPTGVEWAFLVNAIGAPVRPATSRLIPSCVGWFGSKAGSNSDVRLAGGFAYARERKALEHFANGPTGAPNGIGSSTLFSLAQKGLIQRTERQTDFGPQLYSLTEKGRATFLALSQQSL